MIECQQSTGATTIQTQSRNQQTGALPAPNRQGPADDTNCPRDVAIVTGGASGIGRATVDLLVADGRRVIVVDRDAAALTDLPPGASGVVGDVRYSSTCKQVAEAALALGPVRALVNNAGIEVKGSVVSLEEDEWDEALAVNLKSVYLMSLWCLPKISASGGGAIVNVASVHGLATQRGLAAYAATKGGVIALTRAMALDHAADNVRVNCVCPGCIDTQLVRAGAKAAWPHDVEGRIAELGRAHALGRVGTASEVAQVITFLLADAASFVTGAAYLADGGLLASLAFDPSL